MAQPTGSKLSPSELAALEHAFAADPASEAYRPLAEAYLAMGRYMEAMVVCKKGVKAHPGTPIARLLLARVYADQGKDKKALEEARSALESFPSDPDVLAYAAEIHGRTGEAGAAKELLLKAAKLRPNDDALIALGKKLGVDLAPPPPPPPPPVVVAPPPPPVLAPAPVAAAPGIVVDPSALAPAAAAPAAPVVSPRVAVAPAGAAAPAARPRQRPAGVRVTAPTIDLAKLEEDEARRRADSSKKGFIGLIATALIGALLLGGWFGFTKWKANRDRQISKLLDDTAAYINKDTYASYKKADEAAQQILELDSGNYVAHAYLSYISALRWGEQGEGDELKRKAQENLERAKKAGEPHGRIYASEAYIQFFSGDAKAAQEGIEKVLEQGQKSGLLLTSLGIIQTYAGELDKAAATLKQAQSLESNSVRLLSALGLLHRRRGMDAEAFTFYDSALRIDKDHADSLLGKALLVLDANEGSRPKEEQELLLKEAEQQINKVMNLPDGAISARQLALGKFANAQLAFARGDAKSAEKLEQEAFTLDPNNPDIRLMRGRRLLREGQVEAAVKVIREAIQIDEKRASFYVDLSRALLAKPGGAKEAVDALKTAQRTFPDSPKLWILLGDAQRALPDAEAALAAYEKATAVDKRQAEAYAKIGQIYREKKDYAKAKEQLELGLKAYGLGAIGQTYAMALGELGRVWDDGPSRDEKQAYDFYQKALQAWDGYAPAYVLIARIAATRAKDPEFAKIAKDYAKRYQELEPKGELAGEAAKILATVR